MLVPALQTTQREKAAPFLCGAGSVPAAMQLACCNAPCFHSVPHREPERFCRGFQQEQEQGQACFDTNRGQKPGQTQETISEHHKQSLPSSAEGGAHICPQNVWPVAGLQARSVDAGYRSLSLRGHLCHHALFSWMEQGDGCPVIPTLCPSCQGRCPHAVSTPRPSLAFAAGHLLPCNGIK